MDDLYKYINPRNKKHSPMISKATHELIMKHADRLNSAIIYDRDYSYNYFGFKVSVILLDTTGTKEIKLVNLKAWKPLRYKHLPNNFAGFTGNQSFVSP